MAAVMSHRQLRDPDGIRHRIRAYILGLNHTAAEADAAADYLMRLFGAEAAVAGDSTTTDAVERLYPTDRPGWLGRFQPWPCGRCGRNVDDDEPHDCVEKVTTTHA